MTYIEIGGLVAIVAVIVVLRWKAVPPPIFVVRDVLRSDPAAKEAFVGQGAWIDFSRRFGPPYAAGAFASSLGWIAVGPYLIPDTKLGAWLLFIPAIVLMIVGVCLGAHCVARWVADDR